MNKSQNTNYNLEARTLKFSKQLLSFCKSIPQNTSNNILVSQMIRSGTSVGANYREANDALGKKDFIHRLRISRKESKETIYWLELIIESNSQLKNQGDLLLQECTELRNILSAIINKVTK